ncbi:MAG: acyltransferase [Myxococcales bacterium]|nr:acyltransferase [Myxococcales bacterium]
MIASAVRSALAMATATATLTPFTASAELSRREPRETATATETETETLTSFTASAELSRREPRATATEAATDGRLRAVDRLRGVAILLVLAYHTGGLEWRLAPYRPDGWIAWPTLGIAGWLAMPLLHFGFTGVHCFFVLSGFCIHLRAARSRAAGIRDPPRLREFFLRRFWRIYPPYWMALALFGIAVPLAARLLGIHTDEAAPGARDLALHATMLHTLDERTIFSINPAFWSLATEEQFYLAYPLAGIALARFGVRRVLSGALVLSLVWRAAVLSALPPTVEHFMAYRVLIHSLFLPRWFEWLLGCALAEAVASPRSPLVGRARPLALLGALLLLCGMAVRVHVFADKLASDALFSTGFAAIAGAALAASPTRSRALALVGQALAAVGRRAYGLYLVHQPLVDWAALPRAAGVALAALAGWAFSGAFERPFERRSKQVGRPPVGAKIAILPPCDPP